MTEPISIAGLPVQWNLTRQPKQPMRRPRQQGQPGDEPSDEPGESGSDADSSEPQRSDDDQVGKHLDIEA